MIREARRLPGGRVTGRFIGIRIFSRVIVCYTGCRVALQCDHFDGDFLRRTVDRRVGNSDGQDSLTVRCDKFGKIRTCVIAGDVTDRSVIFERSFRNGIYGIRSHRTQLRRDCQRFWKLLKSLFQGSFYRQRL